MWFAFSTPRQDPGAVAATAGERSAGSRLYALLWRVHFYAGIIISPILLWLALTGFAYVWHPQIEDVLYRNLLHAPSGATTMTLDQQVQAARAAFPDAALRAVYPATKPGDTTIVAMSDGRTFNAYVDPSTGTVLGRLYDGDRYRKVLHDLHGQFGLGPNHPLRTLTELAASWTLVLLVTGVFLWFPRPRFRLRGVLLPRLSAAGRTRWRDLHGIGGVLVVGALLAVALTGLTWTRYAGETYRSARAAIGQGMPATPALVSSPPVDGRTPLSLESIVAVARANGIDGVAFSVQPPTSPTGVYTVATNDAARPTAYRVLKIDQYSGAVLYATGWQDLPLLAKASFVGIPFHQGDFGVWNQLLLTLVISVLVFSVISGFVMWWKRRPAGTFGAPKRVERAYAALPKLVYPALAAMAVALPVFGASLVAVIALDLVLLRMPVIRQALS